MAAKHAVLSASSSERWINCPPSARLCENYEDKGSDYAAEGTDAHTLCEFRLKQALGISVDDPIENLSWYNEEMEECAQGYAAYVVELLETAKQTCSDPVVMIEQRVNFSRWVKEGFGTADCIVIADGVMNICDYKHGKGVEVSAVGNPQMRLYALGALEIFDGIYDIDRVCMTIFQPRKGNVSTDVIDKEALLEWANGDLAEKAKLAYGGLGNFHCGEWCRFCKAKAECRERAAANLALARYDFQTPALLDDEEIADILGKVDALITWASDVKEYALQQAVSGKKWIGWKLVEGRSNRKYVSDTVVAATVEGAGYDPYERKVIGVTAMQKMLGKSRFEELLAPYIEKPQGKPTLVPESDKRPAMNTAKNDFMEEF
nr:MAG TPA: Protein of unknown function (DUF2800) [Bacteriophage sp.]